MASTEPTASGRRMSVALLLATLFAMTTAPHALAQLSLVPTGGSGSRKDRKNALEAIPYRSLTPDATRRIQAVVNQPSIFRRLPIKTIESDSQLFLFLIRNPEVVVDIWQVMGVTQLSVDRVGEYKFTSADGAGTNSQIELVYGTTRISMSILAKGSTKVRCLSIKSTGSACYYCVPSTVMPMAVR